MSQKPANAKRVIANLRILSSFASGKHLKFACRAIESLKASSPLSSTITGKGAESRACRLPKMRVIRHQAPRQNLDTKPMQLLGHDIGIHATILVVAEDGD